jgi:hypothetical protein
MPIIDQEKWDKYVENNSKDPYSKCCVDIARRVMELLDSEEHAGPLHHGYNPDLQTPHGLICKADDDIGAGGITGFMAGAATQMVCECHSRGEEFRLAHNEGYGHKGEGVVNPAIVNIAVPEGKTVEGMITEVVEKTPGMRIATDQEVREAFPGVDWDGAKKGK